MKFRIVPLIGAAFFLSNCGPTDVDKFTDLCVDLGMIEVAEVEETCACLAKQMREQTNNQQYRTLVRGLEQTKEDQSPDRFFDLISKPPLGEFFVNASFVCDPERKEDWVD